MKQQYDRSDVIRILEKALKENVKGLWMHYPDIIFVLCDLNKKIIGDILKEELEYSDSEIYLIEQERFDFFNQLMNSKES